jgi:hypothetical protein
LILLKYREKKGDGDMSKIALIILLSFFCIMNRSKSSSLDQFAIKLIWTGGVQILKNYPFMTGVAVALIFRKEIFSLITDRHRKPIISQVGEHPFIAFALGLGILKLSIDYSNLDNSHA